MFIPLPFRPTFRNYIAAIALVVAVSLVVGGVLVVVDDEAADYDGEAVEAAVVEQINADREAEGLQALARSGDLDSAAGYHSARMVELEFYDHEAPDGETAADRLPCNGAEIINKMPYQQRFDSPAGSHFAANNSQAAEISVEMWMDSDDHRGAVLDPSATQLGVGVSSDDDGEVYLTVVFC